MVQLISILSILILIGLVVWIFVPVVSQKSTHSETENHKKQNGNTQILLILLIGLFYTANDLYAAPIIVEGRIKNGTTGLLTKADQLELIKIEEGMQVVETLKNIGPYFRFQPVELTGAPLLIRAIHNDETFIAALDPPTSVNTKKLTREIVVFDDGAKLDNIDFHSGLQISRLKDGLDVNIVYAIANHSKPQRTFDLTGLQFPVPKEAKDLKINLTHEDAGMPVNLSPKLSETGNSVELRRKVRPGTSELSIRFKLDSYVFQDRVDFSKKLLVNRNTEKENNSFFRVLIWRPIDAIPKIEGGESKELEIPNLGKAIQVFYHNDTVTYTFDQGGLWFDNPMASDDNPIFDQPYKTVVGVILALLVLFVLLSIIAGSRIRLSRQ
ncbi:MAG: hypothetical protein H3C43_13295 [Leptonema sp. (in: Bacteria)]|nr:hypothetical protein [Leptonema sp. (in: bacteria)]